MARLDTGWHADSKVLQVGLIGMGLHAWSISYCDDARTDGFVPMGAWPSLPGAGAAVKALLVAGLWERVEGGFRVHDYLDYNRSRAQIEALQEEWRERQSRRRSRVTNGVTTPVSTDVTTAVSPRAPGPGPGPGPVNPIPVPGTPPNPPRKRRGRKSNGAEFDEDGPRYEQRPGADGKREWVEVG